MRRCWLLVACAQLPAAPDPVILAGVEPAAACAPVEAVEIRSAPRDCSSRDMLRAWALDRGANYVVLDAFSVRDDDEVVALARLFTCPQ